MAENCKVIKREVLYVQVQVTSPLSVSSGDNEWTDSDVLRDADGNPFCYRKFSCRSHACVSWKKEG